MKNVDYFEGLEESVYREIVYKLKQEYY